MAQMDNAALAARIRGGTSTAPDGAAEEAFCQRFSRRIFAYGMRHLHDYDGANDLVQEVLSRVLASLRDGAVTDPGKLESFVFGTCKFVLRNEQRTHRRRQEKLETMVREALPPESPAMLSPSPDPRLAECLAGLKERARTVLVLGFYGERSAPEIASELGLTPGNVRVVRHRALAQLLECMNARKGGLR